MRHQLSKWENWLESIVIHNAAVLWPRCQLWRVLKVNDVDGSMKEDTKENNGQQFLYFFFHIPTHGKHNRSSFSPRESWWEKADDAVFKMKENLVGDRQVWRHVVSWQRVHPTIINILILSKINWETGRGEVSCQINDSVLNTPLLGVCVCNVQTPKTRWQ